MSRISAANSLAKNFVIAYADQRVTPAEIRQMRAAMLRRATATNGYPGAAQAVRQAEIDQLGAAGSDTIARVAHLMHPAVSASVCAGPTEPARCESLRERYNRGLAQVTVARALSL